MMHWPPLWSPYPDYLFIIVSEPLTNPSLAWGDTGWSPRYTMKMAGQSPFKLIDSSPPPVVEAHNFSPLQVMKRSLPFRILSPPTTSKMNAWNDSDAVSPNLGFKASPKASATSDALTSLCQNNFLWALRSVYFRSSFEVLSWWKKLREYIGYIFLSYVQFFASDGRSIAVIFFLREGLRSQYQWAVA